MLCFQRSALLGDVSGQPLCEDYKAAWRKCGNDKEMLVRLALSQQSIPYINHACYERMGLTRDYILNNFQDYINGNRTFEDVEGVQGYTYQLYVGYNGNLFVDTDVTSVMWCDINIVIPPTKCPRIYLSNSSHAKLYLEGFNSPTIYLFDDSVIDIEDADGNCAVTIFKYSENATVNMGRYCLSDKIKTFNKELRL